MIQAVIFDMGGVIHTLTEDPNRHLLYAGKIKDLLELRGIRIPDPVEVFANKLLEADHARKRAAEQTGEIPPIEAWRSFFLKDYGATSEQLFPISEELSFLWCNRAHDTPREGLRECLQGLREQGMRLGILSNTLSRTYAPYFLQEYGVAGYFEYILLSSVCGLRKPDARIFDLCRTSMGLKAEEMAYVGDTISRDVIGVKNAGWALMIRILFREAKAHVLEREQKLEGCGYAPDYVIEKLPEIADIIRSYNEGCHIGRVSSGKKEV